MGGDIEQHHLADTLGVCCPGGEGDAPSERMAKEMPGLGQVEVLEGREHRLGLGLKIASTLRQGWRLPMAEQGERHHAVLGFGSDEFGGEAVEVAPRAQEAVK